ncbi:two component response regulator [Gluconacetobacter sacchari DSM 12717]|uniref:Chemotaxis protein CheA n=2 Tax=Gluconacetobacter sacchari TaxID=92759 RepID=A0A7W4IGJ9_9PROT|nr:response regulator [Gluconacetobacter sacchari]MBB2162379.1 response regulator [Gluconacetobacter sacchari]GBQ23011.1 two component response regulator [Gluconacetobacter sacchari DSM 12717]
MEALRQELLAVFDAEYRDHLRVVRDILAGGAVEGRAVSEIFRRVHSLKGAARVVERADIETIAHALEGRLFRLLEEHRPAGADDLAAIGAAMDQIDARMQDAPEAAEPGGAARDEGGAGAVADGSGADSYVQVPASRLDALVGVVQDMMGIAERQDRLWADLEDLAAAARRTGPAGDPAAELARLTRALSALSHERGRIAGQADRAMMRLDEEVRAVTLVPAGTVFGSLSGMVRQIAREHGGGEVTVRLLGMDVRADRRVMQALRDPVIHLLRNAIVHGLESADRREAEGKPARPVLTLSVRMLGVRLLVSVCDDGRGPDLEAIAARAIRQGLMQPDDPRLPETLLALVFAPGFSTRAAADRLAGRGMGLSVVAEAARALHGTARMEAGQPWGTVVTMAVPVSRRQRTTLVVEAGGMTIGLPGRVIERLARVRQADIRMADGRAYFTLDRRRAPAGEAGGDAALVPVVPLAAFLGRPEAALPVHGGALSVVVLGMADGGCCAFAVDRMLEVRILHVSDAGAVGLDSALIPGVGWPRGDRPVFVLNPDTLLERWRKAGATGGHFDGAADAAREARAPARRVATVLVVDDSITTRTLQKTILQTHGYDVLLATDGVEALSLLHRSPRRIDVIVTDVEMPRMDGFALLDAVRSDPGLSRIPVVLMTSRNEEADIRRGLDGGARAYVTKQGFEQGELLDIIRGVL